MVAIILSIKVCLLLLLICVKGGIFHFSRRLLVIHKADIQQQKKVEISHCLLKRSLSFSFLLRGTDFDVESIPLGIERCGIEEKIIFPEDFHRRRVRMKALEW